MKKHNIYLIFSYIISFATLLIVAVNYPKLSDIIPTHFNLKGEADGWGHKSTVWLLPIINIVLLVFMSYVIRIPHKHNYLVKVTEENKADLYQKSQRLIAYISVGVSFIFLVLVMQIMNLWNANFAKISLGISLMITVFLPPFLVIYLSKK
jgi:uncharacterized membrane protein